MLLACIPDGALFEYTLTSEAVGDDFRIQVFVPDGTSPPDGWPWMVLLDGEVFFDPATYSLSRMVRNGASEPGILVGVGYFDETQRERDYLPEGLPALYTMLEDELVPLLESEHAVSRRRLSRSLFGHSYGGLAAVYGLFHHPDVFGGYAAASPSLWVDDAVAFRWMREHPNTEALAYLSMGTLENGGQMAAPFQAFTDELVETQPRVSEWVEWLPGKRHESAAYAAFDSAASWLLDER